MKKFELQKHLMPSSSLLLLIAKTRGTDRTDCHRSHCSGTRQKTLNFTSEKLVYLKGTEKKFIMRLMICTQRAQSPRNLAVEAKVLELNKLLYVPWNIVLLFTQLRISLEDEGWVNEALQNRELLHSVLLR